VRQTASADILRVISGAQTDVLPVFEAICTTATSLRCSSAAASSAVMFQESIVSVAGADVNARINVGTAPLAVAWFGGVIDVVQRWWRLTF
ncbi:MAG: hypothetical protein AAFP69_14980, partial [Planctomycetota bacterium]